MQGFLFGKPAVPFPEAIGLGMTPEG